MKKVSFLLSLSSLVFVGCPSDPAPAEDGGVRNDAPVATVDAPASTEDAPASTVDAPSSTGDGGAALVAACQARAAVLSANCEGASGDPIRVCLWAAYGELCETGNAQLLLDSMECLDDTLCRSFSDPNDGRACLDAAHEAGRSAAADAAITGGCTRCGGVGCDTVSGALELIPYLSDSEIAALADCGSTSCTIDDTIHACSKRLSIMPFDACIPAEG